MQLFQNSAEVEGATRGDIERLAHTSALSEDAEVKALAQRRVREIAREAGVYPAPIHELYKAFGRGETSGWSVPAMNIRTITFNKAQIVFELARELDTNAFIFEIARSEMGYTFQDPAEFATSILAGAVAEGYQGPVFMQGDHYQFKRELFDTNPQQEIENIQKLISESITAGFYNIDIDASTLVHLKESELRDQQKNNFEMTAHMTKFIRSIEPEGITVSVGGEIGHIGGKNSTTEEFEVFMENYREKVGDIEGISKVSVQTGTHHGGVVLPDGTVAMVDIDFSVLENISKSAREKYAIGGTVQHGASTLPNELFHKFPESNALEVHLCTAFQNITYETMPEALREKMYAWTVENCSGEREEGMTDEQFIYKLRKKAFGPFKRALWEMTPEEKAPVLAGLKKQMAFLFEQLGTKGKRGVVDTFVKQ